MRSPRLTYANVMSTAAVVLALGGTSYAAATIGTADLRRSAVTTAKLRTGAVTSTKLRDRGVMRRDLATGAVDSRVVRDGTIAAADLAAGVIPDSPTLAQADARYVPATAAADFLRTGQAAGGALAGTLPAPTLAAGVVGTSAFARLPAVKVTRDADLSVGFVNAGTAVVWPQELYDTAAMHSTVLLTDRTRLTAPVDGVYLVSMTFQWESQANGFTFWIARTTATSEDTLAVESHATNDNGGVTMTTMAALRAGESVQVRVNPYTGTPDLLGGGPGNEVPSFGMSWLSPL